MPYNPYANSMAALYDQAMLDNLAQLRQQAAYQSQMMGQREQQSSMIWVQGETGAKSYLIAKGNTVPLWDSENQVIYIKSVDVSGIPSMRILDYTERTAPCKSPLQTAQQPGGEFVTRAEFDALAARCAALEKQEPAKPETEVK